ncbi:ABC transporter permease [Hespellia stercorisuis]|uniref:Ribose transport system permease protein n=1 Tax=Hespellia stercorisuis DSM 15480 TaxID=1121950 RepID=A0A1M6SM57_9FIRM|nr:ABC transporter permease [Hespellia stercorisuis]SHK45668.1 ribose transport system permease protein [Hespellia stercorisuis DSM 15480]
MSTTKTKTASLKETMKKTEFTLGVIVIALFVITSVCTDNFFTMYNMTNLMKQCAIIGVLAVAQTLIIITGGIDISGGAITGLSCMVLALLQRDTGMNFYLTLIIAIIVSVLAGLINGIIIYEFKVPPMIATLGTQTIIRGMIKIISKALTVSGLNEKILKMGDDAIGGFFPILAVIWIVVAILVFLMLRYGVFGRNLYVLGSGEEVAKLCGIKVRRVYYGVYALAGLLYGIAGVMLAARVQSALPTGGEGYDMNAIAAAVIGGASLAGGRGAISGTVLGTILMVIINNAGVQFGLNTHILEITSGVLIIFAVATDMFKNRSKA